MNILFTPPSDQKILDGTKTMTARCWKRKPPCVGQIIDAQTGYANSTRFAKLKVLNVWEWDGKITGESAMQATGLSKSEIASREGFDSWEDFISVYYGLNSQKFLDEDRTDYFIDFACGDGEGDRHAERQKTEVFRTISGK